MNHQEEVKKLGELAEAAIPVHGMANAELRPRASRDELQELYLATVRARYMVDATACALHDQQRRIEQRLFNA